MGNSSFCDRETVWLFHDTRNQLKKKQKKKNSGRSEKRYLHRGLGNDHSIWRTVDSYLILWLNYLILKCVLFHNSNQYFGSTLWLLYILNWDFVCIRWLLLLLLLLLLFYFCVCFVIILFFLIRFHGRCAHFDFSKILEPEHLWYQAFFHGFFKSNFML